MHGREDVTEWCTTDRHEWCACVLLLAGGLARGKVPFDFERVDTSLSAMLWADMSMVVLHVGAGR